MRLPASYCGILGMRPTHGRISLEGVCPLAPSFDTCGWFARDAGVFERVGRVLLRDEAPARTPRDCSSRRTHLPSPTTVAHALQPRWTRWLPWSARPSP